MKNSLRFYKFKPINKWLVESIVNCTIYAPNPAKLNDPFDCQSDIQNCLKRSLEFVSGEKFDFIEKLSRNEDFLLVWNREISKRGIYSFSTISEEALLHPLMWTHYADEHRGVCLEYEISENFLTEEWVGNGSDGLITLAGDVEYNETKLRQSIVDAPLDEEGFVKEVLRSYLITKSHHWKYEHEGRVVFSKSGVVDVPKDSLRKIYFGLRSTREDIELVLKLANNFSGCESFSRIKLGADDFCLTSESIEAG